MNNIIITSGGTEEKIDEVRKITNNATGKLGSIIAEKLTEKENIKIFYVCSKTAIKPQINKNIEVFEIEDVYSLKATIEKLLLSNKIDFFIHTMAVSDYTVDYVSNSKMLAEYILDSIEIEKSDKKCYSKINIFNQNNLESNIEKCILENNNIIDISRKISSSEDNLIIKLKRAPKIISCIKELSPKTTLIGFKLLNQVTEDELLRVSQNLLEKNQCKLVIGNDSKNFEKGKHEAIFVTKTGIIERAKTKEEIAEKLVKFIIN